MNDLFEKLNTLVKAAINDFVGEDLPGSRRRSLEPGKLGKNIDREIAALRQRINEAIQYEGELQARVLDLEGEISRWDSQADDAVTAGRDADARHAIEQMQRAQQRLTMAEADLRAHQRVTQELIERVNTLEAAVADSRRAQAERESAQPDTSQSPSERGLSDVLRDAREKIARMGDLVSARLQTDTTPEQPARDQAVDDDLDQRRERLSKRK